MPYRRLPNTDNARIKALHTAIAKSRMCDQKDLVQIDIHLLNGKLRNFESASLLYKSSLSKQIAENNKFQKQVKNARIYISHFIQVLNLAVMRNEIKKEAKLLYQLDPNSYTVPDLSSNDLLVTWGNNLLKGEQERLSIGGTAIYNPAIARVNVFFSQFKDGYTAQKKFQEITIRHLEIVSQQRYEVDRILCLIWNQIEEAFAHLPNDKRIEYCKEFGVVYYLRKEERKELEKIVQTSQNQQFEDY